MENNRVEFNGTIITFVSVTKNKSFGCEEDCYDEDSCSYKNALMINPTNKKLCATEVIVNVLNPTEKAVHFRRDYWKLLDSDAYTYSAHGLCFRFESKRVLDSDSFDIEPGTRVRLALRFPELEKDVEVSALIVSANNESARINIAPLSPQAEAMLSVSKPELSDDSIINSYGRYGVFPGRVEYLLLQLERNCYSRTHNTLTSREATKLENEINTSLFEIKQLLHSYPQKVADVYHQRITSMMDQYQKNLEQAKEEEKQRVGLNQRVDDLYNLTDREFEVWSADLFESLGFNVELTPQSNDKGIDVICRKDGKVTVVQCKKYKGVVGSPDIQRFIGAMQNACTDEGYFLTTGTFSVSAEKAAQDTKIVLCDKIKIAELIEIALTK